MPVRPKGRPRQPILKDLYFRVKDHILDRQTDREEALPPTKVLAEEFEVSPSSMNKLLKRLEAEGLVRCRAGDGSYILPYEQEVEGERISNSLHDEELTQRLKLEVGSLEYPTYSNEFWAKQYREFQSQNRHMRFLPLAERSYHDDTARLEDLPDVFQVPSVCLPFMVESGLLEPLDAYMERCEMPELRCMNLCRYRGETYGIPQDSNANVIFANVELLQGIGVDPDTFEATPEALLELASKFCEKYPMDHQYLKFPSHTSPLFDFGLLDERLLPDVELHSSREFRSAFEWIEKLNAWENGVDFRVKSDREWFQSGRVLFHACGAYYAEGYRDLSFSVRVYPFQGFKSGPISQNSVLWCMPRGGRRNIHGWQWLQHVCGVEFQAALAKATGRFPARKDPQVMTAYEEVAQEGLADFFRSLPDDGVLRIMDKYQDSYWYDIWRPALIGLLQRKKSIDEALEYIRSMFPLITTRPDFEKAQTVAKHLLNP